MMIMIMDDIQYRLKYVIDKTMEKNNQYDNE